MSTPEIPDVTSLPLGRRVVTGGNDDKNKSEVLYDDTKGHVQIMPDDTVMFQTLWFTDDVPVDCSAETSKDPTGNKTFRISNDGSVCMFVWMRPGASSSMHQTKSIDYGVVLEGEIVLELENGDERLMKTGDVVVQRETMHAWHNRHPTAWSKLLFVLVATKNSKESNL